VSNFQPKSVKLSKTPLILKDNLRKSNPNILMGSVICRHQIIAVANRPLGALLNMSDPS